MKQLFPLLLSITPWLGFSQDKGIQFEKETSWTHVLAKAKAEHKYIFVDCYTTWCGPCKFMAEEIFPMEKVGTVFNKYFINVKLQLDTSAKDNDDVKNWYQSALDLRTTYAVKNYPTYLFFDDQGQIVHRFVGSSDDETFLDGARNAMNPDKQYYALVKKYRDGQRDSAFLREMANAALATFDRENGSRIGDEYMATQSDFFSKSNLLFIQGYTQNSTCKGFRILLENPERVDSVLGKGRANLLVTQIIMREEIFNKMPANIKENPDWKSIEQNLKAKYPNQSQDILINGKIYWYERTKDWNNYREAVDSYRKKYTLKVKVDDLNNYAWAVFLGCKDNACLLAALEWSKQSFAKKSEPVYMDTYANLLYKLGRLDQAIAWETKAQAMVEGTNKKPYQDTIDKMKHGEKLWNE